MKLPLLSAAAIAGLIAILLLAAPLAAQEGNQLDGDIRLFTVLTALNVAGYDQGLGSPSDSPVRQAIREVAVREGYSHLVDWDAALEVVRLREGIARKVTRHEP